MRGTIRDRLSHNARTALVGRDEELIFLRRALVSDTPVVVHLYGLQGIGKSALATAFAEEIRSGDGGVIFVDCAAVEPTERGLLNELGTLLDCETDLATIAVAIEGLPSPGLLLFDGYEVFHLLDAWVRQVFVPALPDHILVLFTSKLPPGAAWTEAPGWQALFEGMQLTALSERSATELLTELKVPAAAIAPVIRFAAGHPLALTLAAQAARLPASERNYAEPADAAVPLLARRYLAGISDPTTREVLRQACVARRISLGLLRVLSPAADPVALYADLVALPFVSTARDGLAVHDLVREALAADLLAEDPELHRRCRQAAWRYISQDARAAAAWELWRCTADLIHLIRNPVVREAFFPRSSAGLAVEPARPEDLQAILDITNDHDGAEAVLSVEKWWHVSPAAFFVVRSADQPVAGYYCLLDAKTARSADEVLQHDKVTASFLQNLDENPIPATQTALFLRRWLGRSEGERPSAVQAACWLDVKRHYLERRPELRRVYIAVNDFQAYAAVAAELGFKPVEADNLMANWVMQSAVLDMGPASVDGWLLQLAADELGIEATTGILDQAKRTLHVEGNQIALTRREFNVMAYLSAHENEPVGRDTMIHDIWGLQFDAGSNVVDAVVASLRRKLGGMSDRIETVRGFGYLYRSANQG